MCKYQSSGFPSETTLHIYQHGSSKNAIRVGIQTLLKVNGVKIAKGIENQKHTSM